MRDTEGLKKMHRKRTLYALGVVLTLAMLSVSTTGCDAVRRSERDYRTDRRTVDLEGAGEAKVEIEMGAGQLSVREGRLSANGLMQAEFQYSVDSWKPDIDYDVADEVGELLVRQPGSVSLGSLGGDLRYIWDIELSDDVPLYLETQMGAGETDLDLSELDLYELDLGFGAGDATVDLAGDYGHGVGVRIDGGAGALTLYLPEEMGVRVEVDQGIGEVVADGFVIDGDRYVNEAYEQADDFIDVDIEAGVGQVELVLQHGD